MEKALILDEETLKKGWGAEGQYWFSVNTYTVKDIAETADIDRPHDSSETEFMLSIGYIPFFHVNRIEMSRAYIEAVGSRKLKERLLAVPDSEFVDTFWKYFDAYKHLSDGYEEFQLNYLIKKAVDWCDDNGIKCIVE